MSKYPTRYTEEELASVEDVAEQVHKQGNEEVTSEMSKSVGHNNKQQQQQQ
jgi:hypothetical protein